MTEETLDAKVREQLIKDYDLVRELIRKQIIDKTQNYFVVGENYLTPTISSEECDILNKKGKFEYLRRIRIVLEHALNHSSIPKDTILPRGSPEYLKGLIK